MVFLNRLNKQVEQTSYKLRYVLFFHGSTILIIYIVSCYDTVQETNWDAQREKAFVNTYAHASASQICLQKICGQQQNFQMAGPTFGSKSGPQNGAQAKTLKEGMKM